MSLTLAACSGATSADVVAQQLTSLTEDTDLVTLTAGSNDLHLFRERLPPIPLIFRLHAPAINSEVS
ncbi:hypothetical protein AB0J80_29560 [Actinoplanes sp. NPDC049548]|uniref:hypothetical protein n=1 Tax=Actinoplanes sp. NPDC049548 TaxID=3155152 RepID=UPI003447A8A2